jgi:hypothetical protein
MRRWCSGIMQDSHSCDPGSIPGRRRTFYCEIAFVIHVFWLQTSLLNGARVA